MINHSLELRIRNLQIKYALNYTKGIITYNAMPVGHIPSITGNFFITLQKMNLPFRFSLYLMGLKIGMILVLEMWIIHLKLQTVVIHHGTH